MAKANTSLVDKFKALPPGRVPWKKLIPPDRMPEVDEVRTAFRAGELPTTAEGLRRGLEAEFGIKIDPGSFRRWLNG